MKTRHLHPAAVARLLQFILCLLPAGGLLHGAPAQVPRPLAPVLQQAQQELHNARPDRARQSLQEYTGEDHALRHLLLGHAQARLTNDNAALTAYHRALELDPTLDDARKGLAHLHARHHQWSQAITFLSQFVQPSTAEPEWLALYAQAALASNDLQLARILLAPALTRFPNDLRFRQLDLALLLRTEDFPQAKAAIHHLLAAQPANPNAWDQLAAVASRQGDTAKQRLALEAALLAEPHNLDRHRQFLSSLLLAGDWLTALDHGETLLAGALAEPARQDPATLELLIRAADHGQREDLLAQWLALVPDPQRTRTMQLAQARSALRQGQPASARAALNHLIAHGESNAAVFLWAGNLAESAAETAEAETHYLAASQHPGAASRLATLHLARLYHTIGRAQDATRLLQQYLAQYPEDAVARALLANFSQTSTPPLMNP